MFGALSDTMHVLHKNKETFTNIGRLKEVSHMGFIFIYSWLSECNYIAFCIQCIGFLMSSLSTKKFQREDFARNFKSVMQNGY